ncbi:MAG: helix-turn-helix domain-containing protein [Corallococcus sp.]|nr:helix-turn-helix domain-containing protein [Corallococcus sp.]
MTEKGGLKGMTAFKDRVKEIMREKKLSQKELSKISGITEPSLCRYLRGDIEPRADVVQNIAKALGVSAAYLIGASDTYVQQNAVEEVKLIVARNRNIFTASDKKDIISILYGEEDDN